MLCCFLAVTLRRNLGMFHFFGYQDNFLIVSPWYPGYQGETMRKLSQTQERRSLWLNAICRSDDSWRKTECWRVCSKHFIQGSSSSLLERDNPDWVPSLCLGYAMSGTGVECIVGRYKRKERVLESA